MFSDGRLICVALLTDILVFFDPGLKSSLSVSDLDFPTLAGDFVDNSGSLLHGEWIFHSG